MPPIENPVVPGLGVYGLEQARAQRAFEQALAALKQHENRLYASMGLSKSGGIDPHSTFGAMPYVSHQFGQAWEQLKDVIGGREIGSTGIAAQPLEEARYAVGKQRFDLMSQFLDNLSALQSQRLLEQQRLSDSQMAALLDAIGAAIQTESFPPADVSDLLPNSTGTRKPSISFRGRRFTNRRQLKNYLLANGLSVTWFKRTYPKKWRRLPSG